MPSPPRVLAWVALRPPELVCVPIPHLCHSGFLSADVHRRPCYTFGPASSARPQRSLCSAALPVTGVRTGTRVPGCRNQRPQVMEVTSHGWFMNGVATLEKRVEGNPAPVRASSDRDAALTRPTVTGALTWASPDSRNVRSEATALAQAKCCSNCIVWGEKSEVVGLKVGSIGRAGGPDVACVRDGMQCAS